MPILEEIQGVGIFVFNLRKNDYGRHNESLRRVRQKYYW